MNEKEKLNRLVENKKEDFIAISDAIWEYAESRFAEHRSVKLQKEYLASQGFAILPAGAGETSFIAQTGSGSPVIGFLGEYDALSGLSQKADSTEYSPVCNGGDGHGCGHNLLGAGALAAAVALKDYMEEAGMSGTIRYYGCPAEESAAGKAFMVREGDFDDCDIALTWHPGSAHGVNGTGSLANFRVFFTFHGKSAHAAGSPHLGRSALDAVELMNVGTNYMREHMIDQARVHYAVTDTGGTAPNVVQSRAQVLYAIRAPKVHQVKALYERVCKIAQGAALMTETQVEIRQVSAYSDYIGNETLQKLLRENMNAYLPIGYTPEELAYAKKFQEVIPELSADALKTRKKNLAAQIEDPSLVEKPVWDFLSPKDHGSGGSTDVGDVSWVTPTGWFHAVTLAAGTPGHAWQTVAQGKSSIAHKGMLFAAKVLAASALTLFQNPDMVAAAKEDWKRNLDGQTYPNALPPEAKPEVW